MGCWTAWTLCAVLILPVSSLPSWLSGWRVCDKNDEREWSTNFENSIEASGLGGEKGLSRLATDLRTGVLGGSVPHVYAVLGGGEWGPRAVVKALLESVYVGGRNTGAVVVVDMEEANRVHRDRGVGEAQLWLKDKVASAIVRCPQRATVVFDNVQALQGQDLLVLDPLLLLFDGNKSIMDHGDMKLSGDGSVFLLLLNEDESEEETEGLNGKDRLRHALKFEGRGFTTDAFVGRVDAALLLSPPPSLSPEQQFAIEEAWREISSDEGKANLPDGIGGVVTTALRDADPRTLQVGATVAAILATGVAAWALGCFEGAHKPNEDESRAAPSIWASSGSDSGGSGGGGKRGTAKTGTAKTARGGGGGHDSGLDESYVGGSSKTSGRLRHMPDEDVRDVDARSATPSRRASSSNSGSSGNGGRGKTTPRRHEESEHCSNGNDNGNDNGGSRNGDTTPDAAQSRAALQTPVNLAPNSADRDSGPTTRSRTRAKTGTASGKSAD